MSKLIALATFGLTLTTLSVASADCSSYSDCGYKGAKHATCDRYNQCVENERERKESERNRGRGTGENRNPPEKSRNNRGAHRAD